MARDGVDHAARRVRTPRPSARRGRARAEHLLATDPGGNFVAIGDDGAIVLSMALVREDVWVLSLAVLPRSRAARSAAC
jgi:hypothetical protein